jgi:branched-chain amino acid transport system substrate-binding protein
MVADKEVVAAIGPQMSGAGKAMTPILSQGGLATITPSSPTRTSAARKFAEQTAGRQAIFPHRHHRCTGANMANFLAEKLKVKPSSCWTTAACRRGDSFVKQAGEGAKIIGATG